MIAKHLEQINILLNYKMIQSVNVLNVVIKDDEME